MRIQCPHCHHALEVVMDVPSGSVKCPSCGSAVPGFDETVAIPRAPLKTIGHFELRERVGRGHFGDVYRARDTELGREVAIKVPRTDRIDTKTRDLFMHEARAAAQLRHANIVRVYDVNRQDDVVYIVSDFIRGETLADRIESRLFEPRSAAELCATVAEALHFAHEAGVVHRDLKPGNIMLDDQGTPHLMDFGLAKQEASEISITMSGDILGTPAYMSPEQARGDSRHADRRSDVYSLGVVLYRMVSGEHPFADETGTLISRVASDEPVSAARISAKLPRDLATICLKAMSKDPARRYATAQDMADDLRRYLRGESIQARRVSVAERSWRWARKNPALVLTSSAALVICAVLVGVLFAGVGGPPPNPTRRVSITTEPPGAKMVFFPIDEKTGLPLPEKKLEAAGVSPVEIQLAPRDYLVVAYFDNQRFHEVLRRVPTVDAGLSEMAYNHLFWKPLSDGGGELRRIKIPEVDVIAGMAKFDGHDEFIVGVPDASLMPAHARRIGAYYLDPREVTFGEFTKKMPQFPVAGVITPTDADPMVRVWFKDAVHYAEIMGKRVPDEFEYEFAATLGGTRPTPWGEQPKDIKVWSPASIEGPAVDVLPTTPPVFGLFSGVAEWTSSWPLPYPANQALGQPGPAFPGLERVVRGGSGSVIKGEPDAADWTLGPRAREFVNVMSQNPGLGFRCARSAKPRLTAEDFGKPVERESAGKGAR